jgi:phosphoglycolate phosphatase
MNYRFFFDIDQTLLHLPHFGSKAFYHALQEMIPNSFTYEQFCKIASFSHGSVDSGVFIEILEQFGLVPSLEYWQQFQDFFAYYLKCLVLEIPVKKEGKLLKGVKNTLGRLFSDHGNLYLFTGNVKSGAYIKTQAFNIHHYFDWQESLFCEYPQRHKLDFSQTLKKLLEKKDFLPIFIGDTPKDILLAQKLNGVSIGVSSGEYSLKELQALNPDYCLESLDEFPFHAFEKISY